MTQSLSAGEVREIARLYVEETYGGRDDFFGAYLVGSINTMTPGAAFSWYRDVDIEVILDSVKEQRITETKQRGYILECIHNGTHLYQSAEDILSHHAKASNMAADSILLDPRGQLTQLHETVKKEFPRRQWVNARCDDIRSYIQPRMSALDRADNPLRTTMIIGELVMYMIALPTLAYLVPLTHRRNLVQLRPYILKSGRKDIYERYLQMLGCETMGKDEVEQLLADTIVQFDRAVKVYKTPVPYGHKLDPCVRPYLVEGSREVIDEDGYREACFWIMLFLMISGMALLQDGNPEEKAECQALLGRTLHRIGLETSDDIKERSVLAHQLYNDIDEFTKHLVQTSEDIIA